MPDILHQVTIQSDAEKIFDALTTSQGFHSWWTKDGASTDEVGQQVNARFYDGMVEFKMRVDEAEPGKAVHWSVISAVPGWEDTRITWDMSPAENGGTNLLLGHRGWKSTDGLYASVSYNWAWYLTSLKGYIEKGKGIPHPEDMG
jgi:uncharacterized protein YndB with AHSA1/START domain